jgi:PAS domain S-box-containing protein
VAAEQGGNSPVPQPRWAADDRLGPALARLAEVNVIGVVTGDGDQVTEANDYFCDLVGVSHADVLARAVDWRRMTPKEWAGADQAAYVEAMRTGITPPYEKEYQRRDGSRVPVLLGGVFTDPGPPPQWASFVVDLSAQKAAEHAASVARAAAERATAEQTLLARLTRELAAIPDVTGVAEAIVRRVPPALGAAAGMVTVVEPPNRLRLLAASGLPAEVLERIHRGGLRAAGIAGKVFRTGRAAVLTAAADRADRADRAGPDADPAGLPLPGAWANLPLLRDGAAVGVIAFGWAEPREFTDDDRELLAAVAGLCGAALDRARLYQAEREARQDAERARDRLEFLAEATALLAALPDFPGLFARLARHAVPTLADVCVLHLVDEAGVRQVAAASTDLRLQRLLDGRAGTVLAADDDAPGRVVRTGRPLPQPMTAVEAGTMLGPGTPNLLPAAELAVLTLPLVARGRVLGVLSLLRPAGDPRSAPDIEAVALDFAGRAALAVDNAQTFAQRSYVAAKLQESLLPARLPELPGVELAAKYVAAEQLADVGGDFYDVFPLDAAAGTWAAVIGDVAGRGVEAAGVTGLARHTLRAVAGDLGPAAALERLNEVLQGAAESDRFTTVALLRLQLPVGGDPARDVAGCFSSAGHCRPLLLHEDGSVEELDAPGTLLGVLETVSLSETPLRLSPGDLLLLYTDGVVEARGVDGLFGEQRLTDLLAECAGWPAEAVVDRVVDTIARYRAGAAADDLAVLVLRVRPTVQPRSGPLLDLRLPATPAAPSAARRALAGLADELAEQPAGDLLADLRLVATELVTNAVRYGVSGSDAWVHLRVLARRGGVRVEVVHQGDDFTPPDRVHAPGPDEEGGRGLLVVQELSRGWGWLFPQPGVTGVWCELAARPPAHPAVTGPASVPHGAAGPYPLTVPSDTAAPEAQPRGVTGTPVYSLPAVARLTGLAQQKITEWSRRYGLVVGRASSGGHLLFTRDDLAALHLVAERLDAGSDEAEAHRQLAVLLQQGEPLMQPAAPAAERVLLLAERDPYAAHLAEHLLRTAGYRLTLATSVGEARTAAQTPPDLAIVDLMMSGGRGLDLVRELRQRGDTPVLALSSLQVSDEALAAGADAFLRKPLQPLTLVAAVHDLLRTSAFLRTSGAPA